MIFFIIYFLNTNKKNSMKFFIKNLKNFFLSFILAMSFSTKALAFGNMPKKENSIDQIISRNIEKRKFLSKMRKYPASFKKDVKMPIFKNLRIFNMQLDNPSWITGFADGEGCFSVSFSKREKFSTGIEARPSFSIGQKSSSLEALKNVANFFDCGSIRYSKRDGCYKYEVRSLDDITKKILPHFEKYPLKTQKKNDFESFSKICKDIKQNKHLNSDGMKEIIKDAYTMNPAGKKKYASEELIKNVKEKKN